MGASIRRRPKIRLPWPGRFVHLPKDAMSRDSLQDIVVAITGAGQGIGRGLAQAFASEDARVVIGDIDGAAAQATAAALRAAGARAVALRVDVRRAEDNAALVEAAVQAFGRLDVMIGNAGVMQLKPLLELDAADWDGLLRSTSPGIRRCRLRPGACCSKSRWRRGARGARSSTWPRSRAGPAPVRSPASWPTTGPARPP
jgi:hypothetical protein